MIGDGEVIGGQVADGDASGADQVQCVTFFMGGKINMLCDIETVEYVQEF